MGATSNASSSESRLCANARWVEVQKNYNPKACRFLITDEDVSHLPVQLYNASRDEGPLRYAEGLWYWNWTYIGEFMLQSTLWLSDCHKVDFIKHHDAYCSIGGCNDRGKDGDRAAGRVIAYVLSRGINIIDDPLITTKPKKALSFAVYRGLWRILFALGASAENLEGSLKTDVSVDAALRAALLRYAAGELDAAKQTASLIGSGEIFRRRLSNLVEDHFGLKSEVLAE